MSNSQYRSVSILTSHRSPEEVTAPSSDVEMLLAPYSQVLAVRSVGLPSCPPTTADMRMV